MRHILDLFRRTFAISAGVTLVYRSNIVFFLVFELMFLLAQLVTVGVGFDLAGGAVAGWTRDQAYLLTAINGLSHQFFICFFINSIFSVGTWVWNGQLDYVLLKPLHPLLSIFFNGQFVTSNLPTLLLNAGLVVYFLVTGGVEVTWGGLLACAVLAAVGFAVRVALALLCISPVFFSERLIGAEDNFWSVASLGRFPLAVYPRAMELALTFALPLGMLASIPASALFGTVDAASLAGALVASAVFVVLAGRAFLGALGRYQSVNSGV